MNKKQILLEKINILLVEVENAKQMLDESKIIYLNNYEKWIENIKMRIEENALPTSKGGTIGTMRGISEFDSLSTIKSLYDAACDVDLYYNVECKNWQ